MILERAILEWAILHRHHYFNIFPLPLLIKFPSSDYLSIQRICRLLGLFLLLPFLSRVLGVDDALTSSVCTVGTVVAYLLPAVGQEDWTGPSGSWPPGWVMFLSAALQFNSVITVIIRSQCTKSVDPDETGRVFAVVAFGQCLVPLVAYPLYGLVYQATLSTFPGAYLVIVSALLVVAFFISVFLYSESRKGRLGVVPPLEEAGEEEGASDKEGSDSSSSSKSTKRSNSSNQSSSAPSVVKI